MPSLFKIMIILITAVIYLSYIGMGIPNSILGTTWPAMCADFGGVLARVSIVQLIISAGTVAASFCSDRVIHRLGTYITNLISVFLVAASLFGFAISRSFICICLISIPYGLGKGGTDAALNNYVTQNLESRHLSWLHASWGIGAAIGPFIISAALTKGLWSRAYISVGIIEAVFLILLAASLPLWRNSVGKGKSDGIRSGEPLTLKEIFSISGAKELILTFFFYCAAELTVILWMSSYLVFSKGFSEVDAARWASMFFIGMTAGRIFTGFLTLKFSDKNIVRLGAIMIIAGALMLIIFNGYVPALLGFLFIGLGCAPIYPGMISMTPKLFGYERSQALIGVEMAGAYLGNCVLAPVFGIFAKLCSTSAMPFFLIALTALLSISHERLHHRVHNNSI